MQRSILAILLLLGLLAAAVGLSMIIFGGGGTGEPGSAVPASASAVLIVPSVPDLLKDLARTRMAPAPGETGWDFLAEVISALLEARGIDFEPDPASLSRLLRGGAALAWVPSERAGAPPHLVLAFEMPSRQDRLLAHLEETILPEIAGPGVTWNRRSHRGHEYGMLRFPGASEAICVSSHRRLALVTVSGEAMRQALSTLSRREGSLPTNPIFRRVRRDLRERSSLIAYFSGPFLDAGLKAQGSSGEDLRSRIRSLLSPGSMQGAGISITVGKRGLFRERVRVLAGGVAQTLPGRIFAAGPRALSTASLLPGGYPLYIGVSFSDLGAAWESFPGFFAQAMGQDPAHLRERLAGLEEFLDLSMQRDLLGAMGNEASLALDPGEGGRFLIALRPSDLPAARRLFSRIDGLARAAEAYRSEETPQGTITTFVHPRLGPRRPSYTFTDSALLIADSPEPLSLALGRAGKSDRYAPRERISASRLGSERAHVVAVASTERILVWLRTIAGASTVEGKEASHDAAWLRRLQDLLPGSSGPLPPSSAWFRLTRDGLSGEWNAPISPVLLAALLMASPHERPATRPGPPYQTPGAGAAPGQEPESDRSAGEEAPRTLPR